MSNHQSIREKLDYLVQTTGRGEAEIMADAISAGLEELVRKMIADSYLAGKINREQAANVLGDSIVEQLEFAKSSVEKDVKWGLRGA